MFSSRYFEGGIKCKSNGLLLFSEPKEVTVDIFMVCLHLTATQFKSHDIDTIMTN